ncbi:hypothetical protein B0H17DRAFT_1042736, partial [Mycena rosella]
AGFATLKEETQPCRLCGTSRLPAASSSSVIDANEKIFFEYSPHHSVPAVTILLSLELDVTQLNFLCKLSARVVVDLTEETPMVSPGFVRLHAAQN